MEGRFSKEYIEELAHKYRNGTLTPQEKADFEAWYTAQDDETFAHSEAHHPSRVMQRMYRNIRTNIRPIAIRRLSRWLPYAAAILPIATAATWFFVEQGAKDEAQRQAAVDIAPGGNRATLTLADGRTVDLNEEQTGIIVGDGITYADGSFVISPESEDRSPKTSEPDGHLLTTDSRLLTLSTPKGGTYQITLPDGSRVWLNSATTLKYPPQFDGDDERVVELQGEAYFAVAPNKSKPFKVISHGQVTEVLGTQFNISAYADESITKTTLVEGSVRLAPTTGQQPPLTLKPGEQAQQAQGHIKTKTVDVHEVIAWKNGRFSFDGKSFAEIIGELSRWYNVDVIYEGPVPTNTFIGGAYRTERISLVLDVLRAGGIDYRIAQGDGGSYQLIITNKAMKH